MAHIHPVEDKNGDVIDCLYYCSDSCNRFDNKEYYGGWYGCVELQSPENCAYCEKLIGVF